MRRMAVPLSHYDAQRIALIKPSALGDIIHALPVLTALRQRYPNAHITWVVNRAYEPLLAGHPDLDATLPFDRRVEGSGLLQSVLQQGRFLSRLRGEHFDLVIDLQGLLRSGLMTFATGAARRVGLATAREGATWFYTDVLPVPDFEHTHAVDRYWHVVEALGAGDTVKQFRVPLPETAQCWAAEVLRDCPRPWLMFGVGARWQTKRWPAEHFTVLARRAQERFGGTVIFVGGREETALAQAMACELTGPMLDLTGATTLPQLAALLSCADVMVANDTGPLHLAAALGRPVVAPYTCTRVERTGPYGSAGGAVETRVWCAGSLLKRCSRLECMAELTPERLWPVLEGVLLTWQSKRRSA
jgi:lipopolysaccharide heptosyltransferase I